MLLKTAYSASRRVVRAAWAVVALTGLNSGDLVAQADTSRLSLEAAALSALRGEFDSSTFLMGSATANHSDADIETLARASNIKRQPRDEVLTCLERRSCDGRIPDGKKFVIVSRAAVNDDRAVVRVEVVSKASSLTIYQVKFVRDGIGWKVDVVQVTVG